MVNFSGTFILSQILGLPGITSDAGEVAGGCWQWESMKVNWRSGLDAGDVVIVLQAAAAPLPDLPKVPLALSLAKNDEARALIRLGIQEQRTTAFFLRDSRGRVTATDEGAA